MYDMRLPFPAKDFSEMATRKNVMLIRFGKVFCLMIAMQTAIYAQETPNNLPLPGTAAAAQLFGPSTDSTNTTPRNNSNGQGGTIRVSNASCVCLHNVQIAAQADGLIEQLLADEGDVVGKGEVLLKIDSRVARAELEVAKKEYETAEKQAAQTAEVDYAKSASEVADAEYQSEKALYDKGSSTFAQARRKLLEAERARLAIKVAEVKHEQERLAADVAKAKVDAAQVQLDLYNVSASYDGVIVNRLRDRGEWIRSGEPVLRLMNMDEMKVEGMVETNGLSIVDLEGAPMKITVAVTPDQVVEFDTRVEFVSPEIEQRRIRVSSRVRNSKVGEAWILRDGMIATMEIKIDRR